MASRYQLIGVRPATYTGSGNGLEGRYLAILRPISGGRRLTAVVSQADCDSWQACRAAIVRDLTRDGVKRIAEDDIEQGDVLDAPWADFVDAKRLADPGYRIEHVQRGGAITASAKVGGLNRDAGGYMNHQGTEFATNAGYLRNLQGHDPNTRRMRNDAGNVCFDDLPIDQQIAANNRRIAANNAAIAQAEYDVLRAGADVVLAPYLEMTALGRSVLAGRRR